MRLSVLLKGCVHVLPDADRDVLRLTLDSRTVCKNDLFIALRGAQADGRHYILDAIAKGAAGILYEAVTPNESISFHHQVPMIPMYQLSSYIGMLAARFHRYPAKQLRLNFLYAFYCTNITAFNDSLRSSWHTRFWFVWCFRRRKSHYT
jgi:UDP-N-acetylmuramyl tripeptide synthase